MFFCSTSIPFKDADKIHFQQAPFGRDNLSSGEISLLFICLALAQVE